MGVVILPGNPMQPWGLQPEFKQYTSTQTACIHQCTQPEAKQSQISNAQTENVEFPRIRTENVYIRKIEINMWSSKSVQLSSKTIPYFRLNIQRKHMDIRNLETI